MEKCTIQKVSSALEIAQVAKLAAEIWTEHYTPFLAKGQVPYMLEKFQSEKAITEQITGRHHYFLICAEEIAVGYFDFIFNKDSVLISKIYVQKVERGKGFAKAALNFMSERAQEMGLEKLRLTVNKFNTLAIQSYEKGGFKNVESVVVDIGGSYYMDDFVFEKKL